jgi:N-acetylglutamate synthase/N-acetylornithine aminotransferase
MMRSGSLLFLTWLLVVVVVAAGATNCPTGQYQTGSYQCNGQPNATAAAARAPPAHLCVISTRATVELYQAPPIPPAVDAAPAIALASTAQSARQAASALEMTTNTHVPQASADAARRSI